jgi:transposase
MAKKYIVDLSEAEKAELVSLIQKGRPGARKIKRANILLLANSGKPDSEIAELLHTSWLTVLRTRRKFVEGGLSFALNELSRAGRFPKIDDKVETILTTLAQSKPPDGRVRWTLQLLADRLVTLTHLESLSYETVRLVLKKRSQALAASEMVYPNRHWCQICLANGRYPGFVCRTLPASFSSDLF